MTLVVLFLGGALALAYALNTGMIGAAPPPPTSPATTAVCIPAAAPGKTIVNVFNATSKNGLARTAATAMRAQGFVIAVVANDPLQKKVTGAAEIRYGPTGAERAQAVLLRVPSASLVKDTRTDTTVDLVLGDRFTRIVVPAKGAGTCPPVTSTSPASGTVKASVKASVSASATKR